MESIKLKVSFISRFKTIKFICTKLFIKLD